MRIESAGQILKMANHTMQWVDNITIVFPIAPNEIWLADNYLWSATKQFQHF